MRSILVLASLCFIGLSSVSGISQKVFNFTSFYNGNFDNRFQAEQSGDNHDFVQFRIIPVDIECLRPAPAVYLEEFINNTQLFLGAATIIDDSQDTVSLKVYTFTDKAKYTNANAEVLSNIPCADLQEVKGCIASYRVATEGFVYGNFPHCGYTINGEHPRYTDMITCDSLTSTYPLYTQEKSPIEPYEFQISGQKYQLVNQPDGFVAPCGN